MYAQVVHAQVHPGSLDEAIRIFNSSIRPAAREQNGFKDSYFLVDREANRILGFSFWETEADVSAIAASGFYQEQVGKLAAVFAGPPERDVYEVAPA